MTSMILVALMQVSTLGADQGTFEEAYRQSLTTGRPLVVLIGATWCPGCQTMKNSVLPRVAKAGGLERVVFFYLDLDRQRQLATRLKRADSIPQLIRFDRTATGWKTKCLVGAKSPREVYEFINAGLIKKTKTTEVSMTKRPQKQSRRPAPAKVSTSQKAASQSPATTGLRDSRSDKRKARPKVAKTVEGPSEWMPLNARIRPENSERDDGTAYRSNQANATTR